MPGDEIIRSLANAISIRRMEIEDVDEVLPVAASALFNPWSKNMLLEELAQPFSHCFILSYKGDGCQDISVGFICFRNVGEESELLNIGIDPQHRQKGLGKKLMEFYIDFCGQKGVKKYYLEVDPKNLPAVRLYQSFGFQQAGNRKFFYQGRHDALVMER